MSRLPVIVAVDGSDDSPRALDWALAAARLRAAPLRVVHARQHAASAVPGALSADALGTDDDPVLDQARTYLEGAADRLRTEDLGPDGTVEGPRMGYLGLEGAAEGPRTEDLGPERHAEHPRTECLGPDRPARRPRIEYLGLEGEPGAVLPELGSTAQLLVLGSRERGGFASLLLGSNGMAAARDATCPVVVVPRPGREVSSEVPVGPGPRVVVGLHVDSPDEGAPAFAFAEAALRGARLQVVAAYQWPTQTWASPGEPIPPPADQDAVENETRALAEGFVAPYRTRHPEVVVELYVAPGDAAGHLVAASKDADLVVVGRHRRLLAPARMTGSVTRAVLLHAASPVAVVPPGALEPAGPPEE